MDCILSTESINASGYSYVSVNGKPKGKHRLAWEEVHGEIPKGFIVRHTCRNRNCYNIKHLELGTYSQNNSVDRVRDGTDENGEKSPSCKLTTQQRNEIFELSKTETQKEIAARFGISQGLVSMIVNGKRRKLA